MICRCGKWMIKGKFRRSKREAWVCTKCGYCARLIHQTGRREIIWNSRRYGKKAV